MATDGADGSLTYGVDDKLCLNGRRLIQTDADGVTLPFPQKGDAGGLAQGQVREYRTERDAMVRVRAYGTAYGTALGTAGQGAATNANWGPKYFVVWTRSGRVQTYGFNPAIPSTANALIGGYSGVGQAPVWVWALARDADAAGNNIDYTYDARAYNWGPGGDGVDWVLMSATYGGNAAQAQAQAQAPTVRVNFQYNDTDRNAVDRALAWFAGVKKVAIRRLESIAIQTPIGTPTSIVKLAYQMSPSTYRFT